MKMQQLLFITLCSAICCWQIAHSMFVSHKNCNGQTAGTYVANPGNCNQYIRCNGLRSTLGECPIGTYFNPLVLSCDKSKNGCKALQIEETQSTTATTIQLPATTLPSTVVSVTPPPTTTTETTDYEESNEVIVDYTPLIFNNQLPSYVLATYIRPVCNPWLDQAFPHPTNCEYYYYCMRGFLTVRRCSFGYFWDMQRKVCLPRHLARCWSS